MCSNNSPTCVLSVPSSCIQEHQRVSTISSEVETSSAFFCGERSLSLESQTTPMATQTRCCPMVGILPAITRSHDIAEDPQQQTAVPTTSKSSKSNKCGWKTSRFFSKTMSSGEILRGLKKLSLTSSGSTSDTGVDAEPGKPRKSKSGQLKKRSSSGNDDGAPADDEPKARSPRSPGSFRPLSKAMSVSEPGSSSKTSNLGIVCRKEDLKAILCTASKKFPLSSPCKRRKGQTPLRQTKSASFDTPEDGSFRKEPVRRSGSEESRTKRTNLQVVSNETLALSLKTNGNDSEIVEEVIPVSNVVDNLDVLNNLQNIADQQCPNLTQDGSLSTVKWDECEVVDAVIIGDAIETFLKGSMCGSEKKVSFRKSYERKTKSDG